MGRPAEAMEMQPESDPQSDYDPSSTLGMQPESDPASGHEVYPDNTDPAQEISQETHDSQHGQEIPQENQAQDTEINQHYTQFQFTYQNSPASPSPKPVSYPPQRNPHPTQQPRGPPAQPQPHPHPHQATPPAYTAASYPPQGQTPRAANYPPPAHNQKPTAATYPPPQSQGQPPKPESYPPPPPPPQGQAMPASFPPQYQTPIAENYPPMAAGANYPPQTSQPQNYPPAKYPPQPSPQAHPSPHHQNSYQSTQNQPVQFPPQQPNAGTVYTQQPNATFYEPQPNVQAYPPQTLPPDYKPALQPNVAAAGVPVQNPAMMGAYGTNAANQGWTTGLFDCMDDPESALISFIMPCLAFGQIAEIIDNGHSTCATSGMFYGAIGFLIGIPCLLSCTYRTKLRSKFDLVEAPAPDWIVHFLCECCALSQEYRELKNRGIDPALGWYGNMTKNQNLQQQQVSMVPPTSQTMMG